MQCDGPAAEADIPITIKYPPLPRMKHIGSPYRCSDTSGEVWFPMRITATGPAEVSSTERVALTISPPQYLAARMAAASGSGRAPQPVLTLHAALPVAGAQTGVVQVSGKIGNSGRLSAAGSLALTAAGQDAILRPSRFGVAVRLHHRVLSLLSCRLAGGHDPAGATLTVAAGPADSAGTPSGAPATGGGTGPVGGINRALAFGGAIALLGGAGVTVAAFARRRRQRRVTA